MTLFLAAVLAAQCPGGSCNSGGFVYFPTPLAVQQTVAAPDVPLAEGVVSAVKPEGGVVRVTIDGKEWHVQTTAFNAAMLNATANVSGRFRAKLTSQTIELLPESTGTGAKAADAAPDCNCEKCSCAPCRCGSKGLVAKPAPEPHSPAIEAIPHNDDPVSGIPNFGIDTAKMQEHRGRQRYTTNDGREISKQQSSEMLNAGADGVPDDSKHLFLTTIGTPEQQQAVKAVVDANPATFDKVRCKYYLPTDDMIKDKGFASGSPSINLQSDTGKVLTRFESMPEPPLLVGEVNKRRPDYDPNKDPRPDKPFPKPDPNQPANPNPLAQVPWWVWAIAGVVLLTRKQGV